MMHQHLTLYFKEMPQLCHGDVLLLPSVPARGKRNPCVPTASFQESAASSQIIYRQWYELNTV